MKIECNSCKKEKDLKFFHKDNRKKTGMFSKCKSCTNEVRNLYRKTKKGLVERIYYNQITTSKARNHNAPNYTKIELANWLFNQDLFYKLHTEWMQSKYEKLKTPSVDRKDDYKPYTLDNIRLTTWGENNKRSHHDMKNGINNKQSKAVIQYDLNGSFIKEHYSVTSAALSVGLGQSSISIACSDENKTSAGYKWKFK